MRRNLTNRRNNRATEPSGPIGAELDRIRELETENALLRARVAELNRRIDQQIVARVSGGHEPSTGEVLAAAPEVDQDTIEADEDDAMDAFEAFLAETDPHLDRVQRFLLG